MNKKMYFNNFIVTLFTTNFVFMTTFAIVYCVLFLLGSFTWKKWSNDWKSQYLMIWLTNMIWSTRTFTGAAAAENILNKKIIQFFLNRTQ